MANAIQIFVANTACCLATNIKKTDDKLKYGSEDMICCINKDFIANVMLNLLMCNQVANDLQWYVATVTLKYLDDAPSLFPDTFTLPSVSITSYDGSLVSTLPTAGLYTATTILDFNEQMYDKFAAIGFSDPSVYLETVSFNSTTGQMVLNIHYTEYWGDLTNTPTFDAILTGTGITAEASVVYDESEYITDSCLSTSDQCDIKDHLTTYCKTC